MDADAAASFLGVSKKTLTTWLARKRDAQGHGYAAGVHSLLPEPVVETRAWLKADLEAAKPQIEARMGAVGRPAKRS